ncbi:hypothetical protein C8Q73DRAFT_217148 [Cubamyces lactineus]|nr:hypothetical protein C8Q73DRAFT_217148 [Cubamyces lactineus]
MATSHARMWTIAWACISVERRACEVGIHRIDILDLLHIPNSLSREAGMRFFMKCSLLAILAGVATLFVNAEFFNAPTNGTQVVAGSYFNITWDLDVVNALFSGANATNVTSSGTNGAQPTTIADMRRWIKVSRRQDTNSTSASDTGTSGTANATPSGMGGSGGSANGTTSSATGTETGAGATPTLGMNRNGTFAQCIRGIPAVMNGSVPICSILQVAHVGKHCTPALFSTINLDVTTGWFTLLVPYASTADEYAIELIFQDGASESDFVSPPFSIVAAAPSS